MATVTETLSPAAMVPAKWPIGFTTADLSAQLGDIPPDRIVQKPAPGTATEKDLITLDAQNLFCELIDGVLVRKTVGAYESELAILLGSLVLQFVKKHGLGKVTGTDGPYRLGPENVRYPDVAFFGWETLAGRTLSEFAIAPFPPDLAVEILSASNTAKEMDQKLRDYFAAGVKVVWYVDPIKKSAICYTSLEQSTAIDEDGYLVGDPALPGFRIKLGDIFEDAMRPETPPERQAE
jgi:Uma2 family endonuclease